MVIWTKVNIQIKIDILNYAVELLENKDLVKVKTFMIGLMS